MKMRVTIGLFNVSLKSLSFSPVKHSVKCSHFIYFDWCDIACFGYLVHSSKREPSAAEEGKGKDDEEVRMKLLCLSYYIM